MNKLFKLLATNRRQAQPVALAVDGDETTIYLYDVIVDDDLTSEWGGGVSAQSLVPQIRNIKSGTIHLRINSPGGSVPAAQSIIAAIQATGAKVIASIDGIAASAATLIAISADEVEIANGALFMIHCAHSFAYGNASDLVAQAGILEKADGIIAGQYATKTGTDAETIKSLMIAETWYTAQEAVDAKFVDRISSSAKVKNTWNLSAYEKAPIVPDPTPDPPVAAKPAPVVEPIATISEEHRERQLQRLRLANHATHQ